MYVHNSPGGPGKALVWVPCCRSSPQDLRAQLHRRRRVAAARSVPLDCGCRDPGGCHCTDPPLSDRAVTGWAKAARHLLERGLLPLVPIEVRRALWRRGDKDRALAEHLHDACGGEAA